MPNIILENFKGIITAIELIEERFKKIRIADDFILTNEGTLILDAISMRLQVIGELLKKIHKLDNNFFDKYPEINWQQIMRLRDIISHHYENIDHEIIFDICKHHIPQLKTKSLQVLGPEYTK